MKTIEEIKDLFLDVESEYTYKIKQYTIDLWERIYEELYNEEMTVTEESFIGSLQYRLSTFLEICDKSLVDYEFISKLYNILVED